MIVYHATADMLNAPEPDLGLFLTLERARRAVLEACQERWDENSESEYPYIVEDLQPWFESGHDKDHPDYSCQYEFDDVEYFINAREVLP